MAKKDELVVDINDAEFEDLIKIPGVGLKTAMNIMKNRPIKDFKQLSSIGVPNKSFTFIEINKLIQTTLKSLL